MLCTMIDFNRQFNRQKAIKTITQLRMKPPKKQRMKKLMGIPAFEVPALQLDVFSGLT